MVIFFQNNEQLSKMVEQTKEQYIILYQEKISEASKFYYETHWAVVIIASLIILLSR